MTTYALTRIRNNQVYNSDIYADAKVVAKSISGGLLSDNFTYVGNMTIGNLTVNGNTTTLDTTNLVIADPMFSINRNATGAPAFDLGIVMGRGSATNVAFIWEESSQQFQLQYTTQSTSATTFGVINNSGYANLQAYGGKFNNTTITTSTVTNAIVANTKISGGTIDNTAIGAFNPNTGVFTTVVTQSNLYSGGNLVVASSTGISGISTTVGALVVSGGAAIGDGLNTSGTAQFGVGSANYVQIVGTGAGGYGVIRAGGEATNGLIIAGGGTGNIVFNAAGSATVDTATNFKVYNAVQSGNPNYLIVSGAAAGSSPVLASGGTDTNSSINISPKGTGNVLITSTTAATSQTTGATVIKGGLGVDGDIYGNIFNGSAVYAGTIGNTGAVFSGATSTLTGASQAASFTTSGGGQHIGYITGAIGANTPNTGAFTTVTTSGAITAQGTISAPSINAGTIGNTGAALTASTATLTGTANSYGAGQGALQITGGFYAGGDSYINGNLSIAGNLTSIGYNELIANAPLLYLSVGSISTYNYELGFYSHKYDAAVGYNHTGLVRNHLDNAWYLFSNIRTEPTNTVDLANASIIYDTLKLGNVIALSGNASTSTTTGAIVVSDGGGLGVGGNIYAGAIQNTPIGNGTASTGAFTTLTTSGTITSQGTITGAGQIIGYLTGAIGANVPNTGVFTSLVTTTSGGNGNVYIGGNLIVTGNINAITANVYTQGGIFYGAATTGFNALYAGQTGYTPLAQTLVQVSGNYNGFVQLNQQNTNNGSSASTDYIATANNGSDQDTYIDMGINSSGYVNATYGLQAANDGYLYVAGNTTTGGGNLVVSTTTANDIIFSLGGIATANEFARMRANTNSFVISSTTASTTTNTGAMQVRGGVGITGDLNVGGNINGTTAKNVPTIYASNIYPYANAGNINLYTQLNTNLTVNSNQLVANLIVHGNGAAGYQNLLVTNGATGQVGIKINPSSMTGNASFIINSTDSMLLPKGTTGQRPSNATGGMIRYNTLTNQLEFYNAGTASWSGTGSVFTIISDDQFTGDGTTTNFTLSQSGTTNSTLVFINGVSQLPLSAYTVSGTTLSFTEAPLNTDIIDARVATTTSTATSLSAGTSAFEITDTGGATGNIHGYVNGSEYRYIANAGVGGSNYFGNGLSTLASNVSCTANVPTVIDSFSTTAFRGVKYVVSVQDYNNYKFQMAEVIMVIGNANASIQTYGVVTSGGSSFCNFYANVSGTTARLYANSSVTSVAKVQQIYIPS